MKNTYRIIGIGLFFAGMLASCVSAPRRTSCPNRGWWCRSVVEVEKAQNPEQKTIQDQVYYDEAYASLETVEISY